MTATRTFARNVGAVLLLTLLAPVLCSAQVTSESPVMLYNLGVELANKGRLDEAIATYQKALRLRPDFPEALNNLGSALARNGQFDDAITNFRKALKLNLNYARAHYNLALALQKKGNNEAAHQEFQEARRLNPDLKPPVPLPITDDFSGDCSWPSGEWESFSFGCDKGAYHIRIKKPGPAHITRDFSWAVQSVSAEVDGTVASGPGNEPGAALLGVGCLVDENHGYLAILKTDGTWAIMRLEKQFIQLAGADKARGVPGLRRTNHLRVTCAGGGGKPTAVTFFVNDQQAGSVGDEKGYNSFNGVALYADTSPGDVIFERFAAREPSAQEPRDAR